MRASFHGLSASGSTEHDSGNEPRLRIRSEGSEGAYLGGQDLSLHSTPHLTEGIGSLSLTHYINISLAQKMAETTVAYK